MRIKELTCTIYRALKLRSSSFSEHIGEALGHLLHAVSAAEHNRDRILDPSFFHGFVIYSWEVLGMPSYKQANYSTQKASEDRCTHKQLGGDEAIHKSSV
jgi:hypothetical protein